jgi:hypothetical protein
MTDQQTLNEAINNYYKLKESYETKINQNKSKIINNPQLTKKEKEQKFKNLKKLCINCKQEGGSIFTNKDGILKVKCGNTTKPCKLDIEIEKGKYKPADNLISELLIEINKFKEDIIKIKLDYLFGYISEGDALGKFNVFKEELGKKDDLYKKVEIFYINVADNPEKEELLKAAEGQLFLTIKKIKDYCEIFKSTENKTLLKTVTESYISDIIPLNKSINDLKYLAKYLEIHEEKYYLIEKKTTLESLQFTLEEGKILSNKK